MTFTTKRAAKIAKCHTSTINGLIKKGLIKAEKVSGRGGFNYKILNSKEELKEIVNKNASRSGFHRNNSNEKSQLTTLVQLSGIPQAKRILLLKIANKYSVAELKLILSI